MTQVHLPGNARGPTDSAIWQRESSAEKYPADIAHGLQADESWTADDETFWEKPLLSSSMQSALSGIGFVAFTAGLVAIFLLGAELSSASQGFLHGIVNGLNQMLHHMQNESKDGIYR